MPATSVSDVGAGHARDLRGAMPRSVARMARSHHHDYPRPVAEAAASPMWERARPATLNTAA